MTDGQWDGETDERREEVMEVLSGNGMRYVRMKRLCNGKTKGRRAGVADERVDRETLQTMEQKTESRRDSAEDERSYNETMQ